jgi:hypothetical protein
MPAQSLADGSTPVSLRDLFVVGLSHLLGRYVQPHPRPHSLLKEPIRIASSQLIGLLKHINVRICSHTSLPVMQAHTPATFSVRATSLEQCPYVVYKVYGEKTRLSADGSDEKWIDDIIQKHSTAELPVTLVMDFANYVFGCDGYMTLCKHVRLQTQLGVYRRVRLQIPIVSVCLHPQV